jgi:hypothetical protein
MPVKRKGKGKLSRGRPRTRSQSSPRTRGRPRLSKKSRVRRRRTLNGGYDTYIHPNTNLFVHGTLSKNRTDTIQRMDKLINEFKKGKPDPNINRTIYNIIASFLNKVKHREDFYTPLSEGIDENEAKYKTDYNRLIDDRYNAFREGEARDSKFRLGTNFFNVEQDKPFTVYSK